MLDTTIDLAHSVIKLNAMIKSYNNGEGLYSDAEIRQETRRHEIVVVHAVVEACESDEIEVVLFLLTPKEIGRLTVAGAKAKRPVYAKAS